MTKYPSTKWPESAVSADSGRIARPRAHESFVIGYFVIRLFDRRRPRWGCAAAIANVLAPLLGIFLGGGQLGGLRIVPLGGLKHPFQERTTPAAAGAGTVAIRQLRSPPWPFQTDVVGHLPPGDVKAETEFVVGIHSRVQCLGFGVQ